MNATQTENPTIARALEVLRAGFGITQTAQPTPPAPAVAAPVVVAKEKPQASAKKPTKAQPARDVWFYLTKKSGRA